MEPRIAMFQRKGSPVTGDVTDDAGPDALSEDSSMPEGGETVMCPNCQCEFDPATGEIMNAEPDEMTGANYQMPEGMMPGEGEMQ